MVLTCIGGDFGVESFNEELANVQDDKNVVDLIFSCVRFCAETSSSVVKLFATNDRNWKSVSISSCSGMVDLVIGSVVHKVDRFEIRGQSQGLRNPVCDSWMDAISARLVLNNSFLKTLCFSILTFSQNTFNCLYTNENLEEIRLSCCVIEEDAIKSFTELLQHASNLRSLKVESCHLEDNQAAALIERLQTHPTLSKLLIPYNRCRSATFTSIANWLQSDSCKLKELDCGRQYLGEEEFADLAVLADALKTNSSLRVLNLSCSRFHDKDIDVLASSLLINSSLTELFLCGTEISNRGIQSLAAALSHNYGLKTLWLTGCQRFDLLGSSQLVKGMEGNMTLQNILLPACVPDNMKIIIGQYIDLNWAGRCFFRDSTVSISIWPYILQRVETLNRKDSSHETKARRANIIFSLLRGRLLWNQ